MDRPDETNVSPPAATGISPVQPQEVSRLRDLSPQQWKSGIAAWLGWLFDGLDMHLYVLVATPFVAELLGNIDQHDPRVGYYSSLVQAAFLIGWALGGSFFGRVSDRIGRSRALMLTILVYAGFTGLSYFAGTWWELLIFRFLAALGIGGEWAVGASLLSETWPHRWRPWIAAVLQTGVNLGVMLASLAVYLLAPYAPRTVFLVGVVPALLGALDSAGRARARRVACRAGQFGRPSAGVSRPLSGNRAADHHPDTAGLRPVVDCPLGVSLLVHAAAAKSARPGGLDGRSEKSLRRFGKSAGDDRVDRRKLCRGRGSRGC